MKIGEEVPFQFAQHSTKRWKEMKVQNLLGNNMNRRCLCIIHFRWANIDTGRRCTHIIASVGLFIGRHNCLQELVPSQCLLCFWNLNLEARCVKNSLLTYASLYNRWAIGTVSKGKVIRVIQCARIKDIRNRRGDPAADALRRNSNY